MLLFAMYVPGFICMKFNLKNQNVLIAKLIQTCNKLCKDQMDHTVREGASGLV